MEYKYKQVFISLILVIVILSCGNSGQKTGNASDSQGRSEAALSLKNDNFVYNLGAVIRGDTTKKEIALVFTGDEFADGAAFITKTLKEHSINASFFFTGNYYRNKEFAEGIRKLHSSGNYMGAHSDRHLLYCDWEKRDSLLVTRQEFLEDLKNNYSEMKKHGIMAGEARFFLPPYEWYNDSISLWTAQAGLQLINFTPGTRSNADYTYPEMGERYVGSEEILDSVLSFEAGSSNGMNGFILLVHIGTHPGRTDKFYKYLPGLIKELKNRGYRFVRIDEMLA